MIFASWLPFVLFLTLICLRELTRAKYYFGFFLSVDRFAEVSHKNYLNYT